MISAGRISIFWVEIRGQILSTSVKNQTRNISKLARNSRRKSITVIIEKRQSDGALYLFSSLSEPGYPGTSSDLRKTICDIVAVIKALKSPLKND